MSASTEPGAIAHPPILLVAYDGEPMSEVQLHHACRSAGNSGGSVRVLHVIVRPMQVPLEVPLSIDEQAELDRLQDRVERIAVRYSVPYAFVIEGARSVGAAVVGEAEECGARTIYLGLRERRRRGVTLVFSGTVRHVLQHAPCPVQIGYLPAGLPEKYVLDDDNTAAPSSM